MNSTEPDRRRWPDQDQFVDSFLAIARDIRERSGDLFPVGPDKDSATYYNRRSKTRMSRDDFEFQGLASPLELEETLISIWDAEGIDTLASFAPRITEAARALHEYEEENDDVSPLIYVMF